ncbi:MAG: ABC transporter permease [Vicinamibacterales bacterium]
MRALDYALREGWRGLRRSGSAGILATAATGLAILVLGALLLITSNVEQLMAQWSETAEFSVFLRDDATSEQRGAIESVIDRSGIALGRTYLSKADALQRFRRDFANLDALAASLEDNPFPSSIEVRVRPDAEQDGRTTALVQGMASLPGVADVRYDREWLSTLTTGLRAVRGVGWTLALLVGLAAAATVASVIRLGLQSRYQEIEIMQLVGSPVAFIQGPFVAEGLIQGAMGSLSALILLGIGYLAATRWWGAGVASVLDGATLRFLSPSLVVLLVFGGMAVGALGGFAASRHAR